VKIGTFVKRSRRRHKERNHGKEYKGKTEGISEERKCSKNKKRREG
jgi:hypothetical protein